MANPASQHPDAYTQNSPTNYTDPTGEWVWIAAGAVVGAVAGGVTYAATHWDQVRSGNINWGEAAVYVGTGAIAGSGIGIAGELVGTGIATSIAGAAASASSTNRGTIPEDRLGWTSAMVLLGGVSQGCG